MSGHLEKKYELTSPVSGKIVNLSEMPDKIFADTLVENGAAVELEGDTIVSPGDGTLSLVFKTQHAFGVTLNNGIEVLVYVGINTAELRGEGFQLLVEEGNKIKKGQPIMKIDRQAIESKGYSLFVPVIIANFDKVDAIKFACGKRVEAGKDKIFTYKVK